MLTQEEVRHVAMLARLGLSDDEVERMRTQLGDLISYINMLDAVDTSSIAPTAQILSQSNILREDTARPSLTSEDVFRNAPGKEGEFFRVPAIMEDAKKGDTKDKGDGVSNG